jgi:hypothetical protein
MPERGGGAQDRGRCARKPGAKLAGQLEATQAQNAALLAAMKEVGAVDKPAKGGKGCAEVKKSVS